MVPIPETELSLWNTRGNTGPCAVIPRINQRVFWEGGGRLFTSYISISSPLPPHEPPISQGTRGQASTSLIDSGEPIKISAPARPVMKLRATGAAPLSIPSPP